MIDLEHDLADALDLEGNMKSSFITDLQGKKYHNMWSFISGEFDDVFEENVANYLSSIKDTIPEKILEDKNFKCLKVLINE